MGYISLEEARRMKRKDLSVKFIETQTMASSAISVALELGGNKAERAIMEKYEKRLPEELRGNKEKI